MGHGRALAIPARVTWCAENRAYNFALCSKHATAVRLLLFTEDVETPHFYDAGTLM
jgi:pullulanase/glycogen debranching enzyme